MLTIFNVFDSMGTFIALYVINILLILTVIFTERKTPSATLAWIMVLAFIPILGFVFYFIFNQNLSRSKINKLNAMEEYAMSNALKKQMEDMEDDAYPFGSSTVRNWRHLIKLNQVYGHAYYTENNDVELITDGSLLIKKLLSDIKAARCSINIEYYIIKRDHVGLELINLLTEKAGEGLEVRLLMDTLGSRFISNRVLKDYLDAGGKVGYFFKPKFKIFGIRFNYRNHRKIVVIDGKIGYTGGYNVAKEYIGEKKKFGYWRDTHIRIKGDAAADLNARFILDWRFTTKEQLDAIPTSLATSGEGDIGVQIVSCGPESHAQEIKRAMMRMITFAEKSVYVQTPYFVPDGSIFESLKMAAQSGIDVRVMIPKMPDHVFVYWATYSYVGELLRSGGRAFIYDNGFLHAKTLVVDGEVCTVGSANFDNRSFKLNFETNAFIYDKSFSEKMKSVFEDDMEKGHELTLKDYNKRGLIVIIKEAFSRLLSDIL